jgi:UDP-glucose 4-epimerase
MNITITGGAGFIGSHTCVELLNHGHNVTIIDNFSNSDQTVPDKIKQITGKEVRVFECDLQNMEHLDSIFSQIETEAVIHFAAFKSVPESVQYPLMYYRNNIVGTLNLLEVMIRYQVSKLVFSSSATVYGTGNSVPYQEDMPTSATNPYGWSKVMIEQILKDTAAVNKDMKVAILRYFNPVGAHPSGLIGEMPKGIPNNLMPYLCKVAAGKLPYLKVKGTDYPTADGTGIRDYIHISDLACGHRKALEKLETIKGTEIYNLGSGQGTSVFELIDIFENECGMKIKRKNFERRPGDISESYADPGKAERELDWKASHTINDMCKDSWNFIRKNI